MKPLTGLVLLLTVFIGLLVFVTLPELKKRDQAIRDDFQIEVQTLCNNDSLYVRDQSIMQSKIAVLEAKMRNLETECDSLDKRIARNYLRTVTKGQ